VVLHVVSGSPFSNNALSDCLEVIAQNHALLLVGNGVYGAVLHSPVADQLKKVSSPVHALKEDVIARGLQNELLDNIELIDFSRWVELTVTFDKTLSWFE